MSAITPAARVASGVGSRASSLPRVVDALLLATVFVITFAKVRWTVGNADVNISDIAASLFVLAFLALRIERADARLPRAAAVLVAFFAAFAIVYLVGFYNLDSAADRTQFFKGFTKFAIHFAFVTAAVAHLARRSRGFYWRALAFFIAGIATNAAYGVVQLGLAETTGGNLDRLALSVIGSYQRGGINIFGAVDGENVYRTNALTGDPNHLAIMLIIPLLIVLPLYLRLEPGHRLRTPLAILLAFLAFVELTTLSRSGLLGLAAGLLVLAAPYGRRLLSARFLVPLGALLIALAVIVSQRTDFFETVLRSRTSVGGNSSRIHLEVYELLPPVLDSHPFFGLGLNTFSTYFEFVTGRTNFGPHSYYVSLLAETGIIGSLLYAGFIIFIALRLGVLRRAGRA
ncbi:MAG: O-antigen ligase family protein, partial [Gaiellales bacterium]